MHLLISSAHLCNAEVNCLEYAGIDYGIDLGFSSFHASVQNNLKTCVLAAFCKGAQKGYCFLCLAVFTIPCKFNSLHLRCEEHFADPSPSIDTEKHYMVYSVPHSSSLRW